MKKFYIFVLYVVVCTGLMNGQTISISAGNVTAFNGDSVIVPINVSNFTRVGAVTIKIQIDTTVLQFGKAMNWNSTMSDGLVGRSGNKIVLAWDGVNGANIGTGKMVDLQFKYVSGNGTVTFLSSSSEIADTVGNPLSVSYTNGSVTQTPLPNAPQLTSPLTAAQNQSVNLRLDWEDVVSAKSYRVQVATDINFTNIFLDQAKDTLSYLDVFNLANEQTYYWRVNATNPTGTSGWSSVWNFKTIVSIPDQPVLVSPANNSMNNPIAISFSWRKVDKATSYIFQLGNDSLFNTITTYDSLLTDTLKSLSNLQFNNKYFWRVMAKNIGGLGVWSSVWSFSTIYKYSINGTVKYANTQKSPLTGISLYLQSSSIFIDSTTTSASGTYSFGGVVDGNYNVIAKTSKIWDGVNSTDALLIRRYSAGIIPFTLIQQQGADVNVSGNINSTDAFDMRRRVVFQINSFPAGDWYFENPAITVNGSNLTKDFNGIVVGDMNGSYDPSLMKRSNTVLMSFDGNTINAKKGDEFIYPLRLTEGNILGAITLELIYPKDELEFLGVESELQNLSFNENDGKIIVAWDDVTGKSFSQNDVLMNLRLRLKSESLSQSISLGNRTEFADVEGNVLKKIGISAPGINESVPTEFALKQNYPNPFNPETRLEFDLPVESFVKLEVFNMLGECISVLTNETKEAGVHSITFRPNELASGIYFYRLDVKNANTHYSSIKKMVYQK